jgi:hypothetical protein
MRFPRRSGQVLTVPGAAYGEGRYGSLPSGDWPENPVSIGGWNDFGVEGYAESALAAVGESGSGESQPSFQDSRFFLPFPGLRPGLSSGASHSGL